MAATRRAIRGRRSDVVDRRDLLDQHPLGLVERRAGGQRGFRARQPHDRRRDAAKGDPRRIVRGRRDRGHHDLGDRLSRPGPDLPEPLAPAHRRHLQRGDQLIGTQHRAAVPGVKGRKRHPPGPAGALQDDRGVGGRQHGKRIAGRRRIRDVAADRAAILDLHAAHLACGRDEHRQPAADERRPDDVGVGGERADRQHVSADANRPQLGERPQVHEPRGRQRAEVQRDVQVGTAGHRHQRPLVAEHAQRVGERLRLEQRAVGDRSLHQLIPSIVHRDTKTRRLFIFVFFVFFVPFVSS